MTDSVLAGAAAAAAEIVVEQLDPRIERMERAILGESAIGHQGLVQRVSRLEDFERSIGTAHEGMENRRVEGDRLANQRIDKVERRFDRVMWIAAGVGLGSGGIGAVLSNLLLSG